MPDVSLLAAMIAVLAFFVGGVVKGVTGMGLPLVAAPILALAFEPRVGLPMMAASIVLSNVWQVIEAGDMRAALARFWSVAAAIVAATWVGVSLIESADPQLLAGVLGGVIVLFVAFGLLRLKPSVPPGAERWLGPAAGAVGGLTGGLTGIFGPPVAIYLLSLGMGREAFISCMGLCMLAGAIALSVALSGHGMLGVESGLVSIAALVPAAGGLALGGWIRRRISVELFQRAVMLLLLAVGLKHLSAALI